MAVGLGLNETLGDHYNCRCPWCGKNNVYVTHGTQISVGEVRLFSNPCHYCEQTVHYRAEYVIQVIASRENIIEAFKK